MAWYYLKTQMSSSDMFGEVAYIELPEAGLSEEEVYEQVKEEHPSFERASSVKSFSELDWTVDSREFEDEDSFLDGLASEVGTASNSAYTLAFGWVSAKEASIRGS